MTSPKRAWQGGTQDREGPAVRERGYGDGPYGSWNEDEDRGDIEHEEKVLLRNLTAADDQFDDLFSADVKRLIIDTAQPRIKAHINRAIAQCVRRNRSMGMAQVESALLSREVVENAVHSAAMELGFVTPDAYSPRGLVKLMEHLMSGTDLLLEHVQGQILTGYATYLNARRAEG